MLTISGIIKQKIQFIMQLTNHQREELDKATVGNVGLLTGTAGVGKTTAIGQYISNILSSKGHSGVAASALSAAAARRLTIKMHDAGIDLEATTIHRMLGYAYVDGRGYFTFNRSNPLPVSYIFIDEASMPDVSIMASVFSARRKGCKVILIGDIEQLSPIGHGAPLRDCIAMKLPRGHLTEIHRNAGRVVKCCKSIAECQKFDWSRDGIDVQPDNADHDDENLFVDSEWKTTEEQESAIENWLMKSSAMFNINGIDDPIWDVQVITPTRKPGSPMSCHALNPRIQSWLNAEGKQCKGNLFREKDKVMCVENNWYSPAPGCDPKEQNKDGKVYVANGNQGRVMEVDGKWTIVEFDLPKRLVRFGKAQKKTASENDEPTGRLELGYCSTIHKAQGSQTKGIIFVGDESGAANYVADRHLVLTAISRMEKLCICVGKPSVFSAWCKKSHLNLRKTHAVSKFFSLIGSQ